MFRLLTNDKRDLLSARTCLLKRKTYPRLFLSYSKILRGHYAKWLDRRGGNSTQGWVFTNDGSSEYWEIPEHTTYTCVHDDKYNCDMSDMWLISPRVDLFDARHSLELNLSDYAGTNDFKIAFHYNDGNEYSYGLAIDNVLLYEPNPCDVAVTAIAPDIVFQVIPLSLKLPLPVFRV